MLGARQQQRFAELCILAVQCLWLQDENFKIAVSQHAKWLLEQRKLRKNLANQHLMEREALFYYLRSQDPEPSLERELVERSTWCNYLIRFLTNLSLSDKEFLKELLEVSNDELSQQYLKTILPRFEKIVEKYLLKPLSDKSDGLLSGFEKQYLSTYWYAAYFPQQSTAIIFSVLSIAAFSTVLIACGMLLYLGAIPALAPLFIFNKLAWLSSLLVQQLAIPVANITLWSVVASIAFFIGTFSLRQFFYPASWYQLFGIGAIQSVLYPGYSFCAKANYNKCAVYFVKSSMRSYFRFCSARLCDLFYLVELLTSLPYFVSMELGELLFSSKSNDNKLNVSKTEQVMISLGHQSWRFIVNFSLELVYIPITLIKIVSWISMVLLWPISFLFSDKTKISNQDSKVLKCCQDSRHLDESINILSSNAGLVTALIHESKELNSKYEKSKHDNKCQQLLKSWNEYYRYEQDIFNKCRQIAFAASSPLVYQKILYCFFAIHNAYFSLSSILTMPKIEQHTMSESDRRAVEKIREQLKEPSVNEDERNSIVAFLSGFRSNHSLLERECAAIDEVINGLHDSDKKSHDNTSLSKLRWPMGELLKPKLTIKVRASINCALDKLILSDLKITASYKAIEQHKKSIANYEKSIDALIEDINKSSVASTTKSPLTTRETEPLQILLFDQLSLQRQVTQFNPPDLRRTVPLTTVRQETQKKVATGDQIAPQL